MYEYIGRATNLDSEIFPKRQWTLLIDIEMIQGRERLSAVQQLNNPCIAYNAVGSMYLAMQLLSLSRGSHWLRDERSTKINLPDI